MLHKKYKFNTIGYPKEMFCRDTENCMWERVLVLGKYTDERLYTYHCVKDSGEEEDFRYAKNIEEKCDFIDDDLVEGVILEHRDTGRKRKVLAMKTNVVFLSSHSDFDRYGYTCTVQDLMEKGWRTYSEELDTVKLTFEDISNGKGIPTEKIKIKE